MGLTRTQKCRVQWLRALKIKEGTSKKKFDEHFNKEKPMIPRLTWQRKLAVTNNSDAAADDLVNSAAIDYLKEYVMDDEFTAVHNSKNGGYNSDGGCNSEDAVNNSEDDMAEDDSGNNSESVINLENITNSEGGNNEVSAMDINMIFALSTEFHAPELEA